MKQKERSLSIAIGTDRLSERLYQFGDDRQEDGGGGDVAGDLGERGRQRAQ